MDDEKKVIDLQGERFKRTNAAKILAACDRLDDDARELLYEVHIPAHELLGALAHRIGTFLGATNANIPKAVEKLAKIMLEAAERARGER
jgi:hypothetical protein